MVTSKCAALPFPAWPKCFGWAEISGDLHDARDLGAPGGGLRILL